MNLYIYAALMVKKYQNLKKKNSCKLDEIICVILRKQCPCKIGRFEKKKLLNQHMACQTLQYLIF